MGHRPSSRQGGLTVVELLIVVALVAIVLTLAAPSFREMIEMQRLKSVSAQVVTDVQFARSEAAARQRQVFITFGSSLTPAMSCYIVHTCGNNSGCTCTCSTPAPPRCGLNPNNIEIKTVQLPTSLGVRVALSPAGATLPAFISFDPATGAMLALSTDPLAGLIPLPDPAWIDASLTRTNPPVLRAVVAQSGRPSVCTPASPVSGVSAC